VTFCLLGITKEEEEKEAEVRWTWVWDRHFGTGNSRRQFVVIQCCEWQHGVPARWWAQFCSESCSLERRFQFV